MTHFLLRPVLRWQSLFAVLLLPLLASSSAAQTKPTIDPQLRQQVLQIIRDNPEVLLESLRAYQQQQQALRQQARLALLQTLKTNPRQIVGQSPLRGANNARVVLVEFSDFQCPYCAKAHPVLRQFVAKHGDTVALVYKHFPLTEIHGEALAAAQAAWAAGQQGKFWEYHDGLFEQQERLGNSLYQSLARKLGLDVQQFERDRASQAATAAIQQDRWLGEKLGVDGTPFFVMNGEVFAGAVSLADLEAALAQVKP